MWNCSIGLGLLAVFQPEPGTKITLDSIGSTNACSSFKMNPVLPCGLVFFHKHRREQTDGKVKTVFIEQSDGTTETVTWRILMETIGDDWNGFSVQVKDEHDDWRSGSGWRTGDRQKTGDLMISGECSGKKSVYVVVTFIAAMLMRTDTDVRVMLVDIGCVDEGVQENNIWWWSAVGVVMAHKGEVGTRKDAGKCSADRLQSWWLS